MYGIFTAVHANSKLQFVSAAVSKIHSQTVTAKKTSGEALFLIGL